MSIVVNWRVDVVMVCCCLLFFFLLLGHKAEDFGEAPSDDGLNSQVGM